MNAVRLQRERERKMEKERLRLIDFAERGIHGDFFTEQQKGLTSLISSACSMTSVNPLSWSEDSSDGS